MNADSQQQQNGHSVAFAELMLVSQLLHRAQANYADQAAFRAQWTDAFLQQAFAWTSHLSTMLAMENDSQALVDAFLLSSLSSSSSSSSSDLGIGHNAQQPKEWLVSARELSSPSMALQQRLLSNPNLDPALVPVLFRHGLQQSKGKARVQDPTALPSHILDIAAKGAFQETVHGMLGLLRRLPVPEDSTDEQQSCAEQQAAFFGVEAIERRVLARTLCRRAAEAMDDHQGDDDERPQQQQQQEEASRAMFLQQTRQYVDAVGEEGVCILEEAMAMLAKVEGSSAASTSSCLQDAVQAAKQHLADKTQVKIKKERKESRSPGSYPASRSPAPPPLLPRRRLD